MERLGERRGELQNMQLDGKGRVRLDYQIPARGLIGFQSEFRTLTAGTGLMFHVFRYPDQLTVNVVGLYFIEQFPDLLLSFSRVEITNLQWFPGEECPDNVKEDLEF